jgi:hypothetical protein
MSIHYPADVFTNEAFANLEKMVASKALLIKRALGVDDLPIKRNKTEITFPWFRPGLSSEETHGYTQFITQLCKTAKNKKRVTAAEREFPNPRFSFRVWLISLGMVGTDFFQARRVLCKALPGNAAWSSRVDPRRKVKTKVPESENAVFASDIHVAPSVHETVGKA